VSAAPPVPPPLYQKDAGFSLPAKDAPLGQQAVWRSLQQGLTGGGGLSPVKAVCLTGDAGLGKTHLLRTVATTLQAQGHAVLWLDAHHLPPNSIATPDALAQWVLTSCNAHLSQLLSEATHTLEGVATQAGITPAHWQALGLTPQQWLVAQANACTSPLQATQFLRFAEASVANQPKAWQAFLERLPQSELGQTVPWQALGLATQWHHWREANAELAPNQQLAELWPWLHAYLQPTANHFLVVMDHLEALPPAVVAEWLVPHLSTLAHLRPARIHTLLACQPQALSRLLTPAMQEAMRPLVVVTHLAPAVGHQTLNDALATCPPESPLAQWQQGHPTAWETLAHSCQGWPVALAWLAFVVAQPTLHTACVQALQAQASPSWQGLAQLSLAQALAPLHALRQVSPQATLGQLWQLASHFTTVQGGLSLPLLLPQLEASTNTPADVLFNVFRALFAWGWLRPATPALPLFASALAVETPPAEPRYACHGSKTLEALLQPPLPEAAPASTLVPWSEALTQWQASADTPELTPWVWQHVLLGRTHVTQRLQAIAWLLEQLNHTVATCPANQPCPPQAQGVLACWQYLPWGYQAQALTQWWAEDAPLGWPVWLQLLALRWWQALPTPHFAPHAFGSDAPWRGLLAQEATTAQTLAVLHRFGSMLLEEARWAWLAPVLQAQLVHHGEAAPLAHQWLAHVGWPTEATAHVLRWWLQGLAHCTTHEGVAKCCHALNNPLAQVHWHNEAAQGELLNHLAEWLALTPETTTEATVWPAPCQTYHQLGVAALAVRCWPHRTATSCSVLLKLHQLPLTTSTEEGWHWLLASVAHRVQRPASSPQQAQYWANVLLNALAHTPDGWASLPPALQWRLCRTLGHLAHAVGQGGQSDASVVETHHALQQALTAFSEAHHANADTLAPNVAEFLQAAYSGATHQCQVTTSQGEEERSIPLSEMPQHRQARSPRVNTMAYPSAGKVGVWGWFKQRLRGLWLATVKPKGYLPKARE
jgi:hypothetical protein